MRPLLPLLAVGVVFAATAPIASAAAAPLPRSAPEAQGISSTAIRAFIEAADRQIDAMHSVMVVRHGHVVAEGWWAPYRADASHTFFSLSKSFAATAVGLAVAEGKLRLDDRVVDFFPEEVPPAPSANLQAMRVRDLLAMSTGHHAEDLELFSFAPGEGLTNAFLALPVAHKPGTHFLYNTPGSFMLSAIVQKATGEKLLDYLQPRLFAPLGMTQPTWAETRDGISLGGYGMAATTEDIARFGQLYLQRGEWQGRRVLPAAWVDAASARQTSNGSNPHSDWEQGYGYQFWRCRHGLYRGDGAFGQFCIVLPEQDAVVAITSGVPDMQAVMNLVWDLLLPALQAKPLPPDAAAHRALTERLGGLRLPTPAGAATSPLASRVTGRRYVLPENADRLEAVALEFADDGATLVTTRAGRTERIALGHAAWRGGETRLYPELAQDAARDAAQPVAGAGAWADDDTFVAKLWLAETPFALTYQLTFASDYVILDAEQNVAFGARKRPQLVGHAE